MNLEVKGPTQHPQPSTLQERQHRPLLQNQGFRVPLRPGSKPCGTGNLRGTKDRVILSAFTDTAWVWRRPIEGMCC